MTLGKAKMQIYIIQIADKFYVKATGFGFWETIVPYETLVEALHAAEMFLKRERMKHEGTAFNH